MALLQEKLIVLTQGINIGELELRAYNFLMEDGVNGVLMSRFDQNTLKNVSIEDIIEQLGADSIDYEGIKKEAKKNKYYNEKDDLIGIKSKDLDLLLKRIFGYGIGEIDWNEFGVYYSESEDAYYTVYEDNKEVELVSAELIQKDGETYRFMCRQKGYEEDNSFLIVELQCIESDFKFISVK